MDIASIQNIPCSVDVVDDDLCNVTFTLPTSQIQAFIMMFSSITHLLRGIGWKVKTNDRLIEKRNKMKEAEILKFNQEFNSAVVTSFLSNMETCVSPREALSCTLSEINNRFEFASYDIIRNALIKNKLLKNTGFYKKPFKKLI